MWFNVVKLESTDSPTKTCANVKLLAEKALSSAALPIFTSSGTVSFACDLA